MRKFSEYKGLATMGHGRLPARLFFPLLGLISLALVSAVFAQSAGQGVPLWGLRKPHNLVLQREKWFYGQRVYPLRHIPAGARLKAFRQLQRMVIEIKAVGSSAGVAAFASPPSSAAPATALALSQTAWTLIGPEPTLPPKNDPFAGYPTDSGRLTALAFDPRDPTDKTFYLGAAEGGLWATTNGGQTWIPLTDSEPSLAVGSIALDPTTSPTAIYIGTGEENFAFDNYYGVGVLKSTDGGKTWTQDQTFSQATAKSPEVAGPFIGSLAVDPSNNRVLLAAVQSSGSAFLPAGIWRSADGGTTWLNVLPELPSNPGDLPAGTGVVFDPFSPGVAYAALGDIIGNASDGVYKSTNDGATWTPLSSLGVGFGLGRITLALGPPASSGAPGKLLAAIADASTISGSLLGVFLSTNGGAAWTKLTTAPDFCGNPTNPINGQCFYDMAAGISPKNPNLIYLGGTNNFGGDTLTVSTDGGSTWSADLYAGNSGSLVNPAGQLHTDTHAIAFPPDGAVLAVGNDGGVLTTSNVGISSNIKWNDLNATVAVTQFYPGISIFPGNPNQGLGGTQDNGTQAYSGSLEWQQIACGDGASSAVTPSGSIFYIACAADEGLFSSSMGWAGNGVGTCTAIPPSSAPCYSAYFDPPLAMDPENPLILYFGAQAPSSSAQIIYQTTNGAGVWHPISPDLSGGNPNAQITTISIAPTSSNAVYAGTFTGHLWKTTNALAGPGAVWQQVNTGLPSRTLTDVVVDPSTSSTAYVSYSGFSSCTGCDGLGHIFKTTNGGTSWTSITGNLPDIPGNALVVDPVLANAIYAATDVGVFAATDGGNTWVPVVTGLPNVAVLGLALDPSTRTLWAGTHGRSMWALQLPRPPTATPSPASLAFANQDVGGTSAAQTVTLGNTGGMALSISSISATSPFSETNTCGSSLAAGTSCTISVTFSPTAVGIFSGTLSISDNLRSSPQTAALSGPGQDFAVSSSPTSASVTPGSSASYTITVAPQGSVGFTSSVSLACSGLPALSSCSFSSTSVTPGSGPATSTLTISTTAPSSVFPLGKPRSPSAPLLLLGLGLLLTLAVAGVLRSKSRRKLAFRLASWALVLFLIGAVVSCGGGGGGDGAPQRPGTPAGSYSVTVTGTSNQLQHSTTVTLSVQ